MRVQCRRACLQARGGGKLRSGKVQSHCEKARKLRNSIAFGSAPPREADSQPISQLARPAVSQTVIRASRQAHRNTQFGFFVSGRLGSKQWGGKIASGQAVTEWKCSRPPNVRSAFRTPVSEPLQQRRRRQSASQDSNRRPKNLQLATLPIERGLFRPTAWSLLSTNF